MAGVSVVQEAELEGLEEVSAEGSAAGPGGAAETAGAQGLASVEMPTAPRRTLSARTRAELEELRRWKADAEALLLQTGCGGLDEVGTQFGALRRAAAIKASAEDFEAELDSILPVDDTDTRRAGSLADRLDSALSSSMQDRPAIEALLSEIAAVQDGSFKAHPGVRSLSYKSETLTCKEVSRAPGVALVIDVGDKQESEDDYAMVSPAVAPRRRASIVRLAQQKQEQTQQQQQQQQQQQIDTAPRRRGSIISSGRKMSITAANAGRKMSTTGRKMSIIGGNPTSTGAQQRSVPLQPSAGGRRSSLAGTTAAFAQFLDDGNDSEELRSEWWLVIVLALPLALGMGAEQSTQVGLNAVWGRMGTTALAAGNYATNWMSLGSLVIFSAVQSLFSLVPQAAGTANTMLVSNLLTMGLLWNCVFVMLPSAAFFFFIGDLAPLPDTASGYGHGGGGCGGAPAPTGLEPEPEPVLVQECNLQCEVTRYSRANIMWLLPYAALYTTQSWLNCLEIVGVVSVNTVFWAVAKIPVAYLFMVSSGLGLVGNAFSNAVISLSELITLYLVAFKWKEYHAEYWHGVDCKAAVAPTLTRKMGALTFANTVQMFADLASSTLFYSMMGTYSEAHIAAYGVADTLRYSASSVSLGLFTATSVRVGTLLGEGDPERAKKAAVAGVTYNIVYGLLIGGFFVLYRHGIANFMTPNPEDAQVRGLLADTMVPCGVFSFLFSLQWGLWSVLEGEKMTIFYCRMLIFD